MWGSKPLRQLLASASVDCLRAVHPVSAVSGFGFAAEPRCEFSPAVLEFLSFAW